MLEHSRYFVKQFGKVGYSTAWKSPICSAPGPQISVEPWTWKSVVSDSKWNLDDEKVKLITVSEARGDPAWK